MKQQPPRHFQDKTDNRSALGTLSSGKKACETRKKIAKKHPFRYLFVSLQWLKTI